MRNQYSSNGSHDEAPIQYLSTNFARFTTDLTKVLINVDEARSLTSESANSDQINDIEEQNRILYYLNSLQLRITDSLSSYVHNIQTNLSMPLLALFEAR